MLKQLGLLTLELLGFILIGGILAVVFSFIPVLFGADLSGLYHSDQMFLRPFKGLLFIYVPLLLASLGAMYLMHRLILKRSWQEMGLGTSGLMTQFGVGWVLAMAILFLGFFLLLATGQMKIISWRWDSILFIGFLLFFLIQSAVEELVTRSYLITTIENRFSTRTALLLSSLIFSIIHGANDNINVLGLINIFLAGLVMGLLFVTYRKIWAPLGLHAGWNFLQGSFLGFEVSGIDVFSTIDSEETGFDWLTGGEFGFEGSVLALIGLLLISFPLWRRSVSVSGIEENERLHNSDLPSKT